MPDEMTKQIAADLGIADLAPEEQQQIISQFGEVALKAATVAVLEKLTPEKRDAFAALAGAGDPAPVQEFLDREVPGHEMLAQEAVAEEVRRFRAVRQS
jgi:hypothetical protein